VTLELVLHRTHPADRTDTLKTRREFTRSRDVSRCQADLTFQFDSAYRQQKALWRSGVQIRRWSKEARSISACSIRTRNSPQIPRFLLLARIIQQRLLVVLFYRGRRLHPR